MRTITVFEVATLSVLGAVVALLMTLSLLGTQAVRGIERVSAGSDRAHGTATKLSQLDADLAELVGAGQVCTERGGDAARRRLATAATREHALYTLASLAELMPQEPARHMRLRSIRLASYGGDPPSEAFVAAAGSALLAEASLAPGHDARTRVQELLQMQALDIDRLQRAERDGLRRLRDGSVLVGVAAALPGLLLFALLRRGFAVQREQAGALIAANENLEHKVRQRTLALESANQALGQHSARVEAACEQERMRIARDMHDDLGALLTALKLELAGSAGSAGGKPRTRRASADMVDAALRSVKDVIAALRPFPLDQFGLWEALRWQARRFEETTRIGCTIAMPEELPSTSPCAAMAVFRIVEEMLTNVARHAEARHVELVVRPGTGDLVIEVLDDGRGIADATLRAPNSFGLLSMRERARALGGQLEIGPQAQGGTRARLCVPLEQAA